MTWTIQTTDLRRRVREVLDRVRVQRDPVVIRSYGTPQAVIIPYEDYVEFEEWKSNRRQRAAWLAELRTIAEEVSARTDLSEDKADELVTEAIRSTREQ
jgi:prevent-host-death family protein